MSHDVEQMARRTTADGKSVILWSDGTLTSGMGWHIKGSSHTARSAYERKKNIEAGWLLMGDVELYDYAEVPKLVNAARKAVRQHHHQPLDFMRRYFKGDRFVRVDRHGAVYKARRR